MTDTIKEIYNLIVKLLKSHKNLENIVTNIYDIVPNKPSIPYIHIYISYLKTLNIFNNDMSKIQLVCKIYSHNSCTLHKILNLIINLLVNHQSKLENIEYKIIPEYSYNINQYQEITHALLNFTILTKKTYVNTIAN